MRPIREFRSNWAKIFDFFCPGSFPRCYLGPFYLPTDHNYRSTCGAFIRFHDLLEAALETTRRSRR